MKTQSKKSNMMMRTVGLMALMLSLAACQPKNNSDSTPTTSQPRTQGTTDPNQLVQSTGIQLKGLVYSSTVYQTQFNEAVRYFMEPVVAHDYIGYVSDQGTNNTGMFIGAHLDLNGGVTLKSINNGQVAIASSSQLLVAVYDYVGTATNIRAIPPVFISNATGTVSGNSAKVTFSDDYGTITLDGQFDSNNYMGVFTFTTKKDSTGAAVDHDGTVGNFVIPTCQVFRCN